MTDTLTRAQRRRCMQAIRSQNTQPELIARRFLHRLGLRYRLQVEGLPGKPDIVLPRYKTVIFVHGCFWHRHRGCKNCSTPTNRREWWVAKLEGNAARDKLHQRALRKLGWRPVAAWEGHLEKPRSLQK